MFEIRGACLSLASFNGTLVCMEAGINQVAERLEKLRSILPARGRVLIITHDYPDPDALASAAALHLLLTKQFNLHGYIVFTGTVTRAENKEMLRHCRYAWHLPEMIRPSRRKIPALFVDTVPWSGTVTVPAFARPVAVFDHHPLPARRATGDLFLDVRVGSGATVTTLYEYLSACGIAIPTWLASMMVYAVATETLDLSRNCTAPDLDAYLGLLARANMRILGQIRHARLPRIYFAQLKEAMRNACLFGRTAWSHLDKVDQPEIVPEIAELLLRMERVAWSFCTAYQGGSMIVSLRSTRKGVHCGSLLKRVIGKNGSGGGHEWMAGGVLDLQGIEGAARDARRMEFVRNLLYRTEKKPSIVTEQPETLARPLVEGFPG